MAMPWEEYAAVAQPAAPMPWEEYGSAAKKIANDEISQGARKFAGQGSDALGGVSQAVLNTLGGFVRGAGSIGATLARPFESGAENDQRRAGIDQNMQAMGAQPDSWLYKGGKLGAEVAGTAGVGGVVAKPVQALSALSARAGAGAIPAADALAMALQTGGFRTGGQLGRVADAATRFAAGGTVGGASAGMVNPEDAGAGALIGGVLPGAVKGAGSLLTESAHAVRRLGGGMAPEVQQLAQRADELGIKIPADRLVNSRPLNAVAAGLNYVPFSGRAATEDAMNSQLNRALSRTFGQDSSNVTQALRKAETALGGKFESTLTQNGVKFDVQLLDDLASVFNKAESELGGEALKPIQNKISEIVAKAETGFIDGKAAYNIKRDLDRLGSSNAPNAWHALELKHKLMDALNRSLGPDGAKEFATVRQQYGNMLDLQKLARNGAEGEVSVARISNMKNIGNKPMQELADIAAQFVKPREGQHGAAQRALVGLGGAYFGGLPAVAAGSIAGRGANMALNSNAARGLLMGPTGNLLGEPEALGLLGQTAYRALPVWAAQD